MKLQTYMAHAGIASRRKSETLISEDKVRVNGEHAHIGQVIDPKKDKVSVEGKMIKGMENQVLFLVYKPVGLVSTTEDEMGRKTVVDFLLNQLSAEERKDLPRLYPVGLLDKDSEGLMIITNDGALTQHITHPSFEVEKTYRITVTGHPTEKALAHLERGVLLQEGMTSPSHVDVVDQTPLSTILEITIHEGRYHQVKRMLLRVGYEVQRLIRIKMGEYTVEMLGDASFIRLKR